MCGRQKLAGLTVKTEDFSQVKQEYVPVGADKAHSLTGRLSEKHAFPDMTWGHAEEMTETWQTELHLINKSS